MGWGNPPYGGNRPQRGLSGGCCGLLRGYNGGTRPMGEPVPNAVLEKAVAGYCQGYRKGYYGGTRPQRGL
jgi:hypothetical protein